MAACGDAPDGRPSVVLISLDTLRADHTGLYGYERDTTPYLDRLATESLVFDRAHAPAHFTLVSHMTMLTGLYPNQNGIYTEGRALSPEIPSLAETLRRAGYQTAGLYFPGYIHPRYGFARGFDTFREHADAEEAGEHLEEVFAGFERDRPFFLFLHLFDVHAGPMTSDGRFVYHTPEPYDAWFVPDAEERLADLPEWDVWEGDVELDESQLEALVALYDGGVRYVDAKLEEWIESWRRDGWLDDTLLIVTGDHGEALGQRGKLKGHGRFFQEGLHVPLLLRHPRGRRAGERVGAVVSLADVVPTVLQHCGIAADLPLPGQSLYDPVPPDRVVLACQGQRQAVIRWPRKILSKDDRFYGVDLSADPGELRPFEATREEFDALFEQALGPRTSSVSYPPPLLSDELGSEEIEALQALGYTGDVEDDGD